MNYFISRIEIMSYKTKQILFNQLTLLIAQTAYPNPFTNSLTVKSDVFSTYDIRIVNESTEVFYDTQFKGNKHHIATSNFPKGTYFLFIKGGVTDKKTRLIN